jgi:hypothetical protein
MQCCFAGNTRRLAICCRVATAPIRHSGWVVGCARTTVEVVVKPKGEKRNLCPSGQPPEPGKPCAAECEAVVRLVEGKANNTATKGQRVELNNPRDVVCITPLGTIVHSTSSESMRPHGTGAADDQPVTTDSQSAEWRHHDSILPALRKPKQTLPISGASFRCWSLVGRPSTPS